MGASFATTRCEKLCFSLAVGTHYSLHEHSMSMVKLVNVESFIASVFTYNFHFTSRRSSTIIMEPFTMSFIEKSAVLLVSSEMIFT